MRFSLSCFLPDLSVVDSRSCFHAGKSDVFVVVPDVFMCFPKVFVGKPTKPGEPQ